MPGRLRCRLSEAIKNRSNSASCRRRCLLSRQGPPVPAHLRAVCGSRHARAAEDARGPRQSNSGCGGTARPDRRGNAGQTRPSANEAVRSGSALNREWPRRPSCSAEKGRRRGAPPPKAKVRRRRLFRSRPLCRTRGRPSGTRRTSGTTSAARRRARSSAGPSRATAATS